MVSKKYNENDVRVMFQQFGTIEECTVLRDANGISKGQGNSMLFNELKAVEKCAIKDLFVARQKEFISLSLIIVPVPNE